MISNLVFKGLIIIIITYSWALHVFRSFSSSSSVCILAMLITQQLQLLGVLSFFYSKDCFDRLFFILFTFMSVNVPVKLIVHKDF